MLDVVLLYTYLYILSCEPPTLSILQMRKQLRLFADGRTASKLHRVCSFCYAMQPVGTPVLNTLVCM